MIKINVAGCRIPVSRDIKTNIKEIKCAIDHFSGTGVDILSTPECALSGYLWKPADLKASSIKEVKFACEEIAEYSKKKKVDLVLGTARLNEYNHWCNSQLFIVDGEIRHVHEKSILFQDESVFYSPGDEVLFFDYKGARIAGLICNDAWANPFLFPETSARLLSYLGNKKVDVIFVSAFVPRNTHPRKLFHDWHKTWLSMAAGSLKLNFVVSDVLDQNDIMKSDSVCPVGIVSSNSEWIVLGDDHCRSYFSHTIVSNNFILNRY